MMMLLPENCILNGRALAHCPYLDQNIFRCIAFFVSGSYTFESNLVIRNIHRYVCKGAEKPEFYTYLFLPNVAQLCAV